MRKPKYTFTKHHLYLPTYPREAYGPRSWHFFMDDLEYYKAKDVPEGMAVRDYVDILGGRKRLVVLCPKCKKQCFKLYKYIDYQANKTLLCRWCVGLPYRSQYALRRAEASEERIAELKKRAAGTKDRSTRWRREDYIYYLERLRLRRKSIFSIREECARDTYVFTRGTNADAQFMARKEIRELNEEDPLPPKPSRRKKKEV